MDTSWLVGDVGLADQFFLLASFFTLSLYFESVRCWELLDRVIQQSVLHFFLLVENDDPLLNP